MNPEIQMLDLVAPTEDIATTHFTTGARPILRRGQIGTVVMTYDGSAFEVEFADAHGRAFALLPIAVDKLMLLHDAPAPAAA
jgi:hypothetical protein